MKPYTMIAALVALVFLVGCSTQARTPWGNLDFKGGSGSECKPYVAPDGGARQLPQVIRPRPVQPVAPVAPVAPVELVVPVPPSAEVSGGKWPKTGGPDLACLD